MCEVDEVYDVIDSLALMHIAHFHPILEVIHELLVFLDEGTGVDVPHFADGLIDGRCWFRGVYQHQAMGELRLIERDTVVTLYFRAVKVVVAQIVE